MVFINTKWLGLNAYHQWENILLEFYYIIIIPGLEPGHWQKRKTNTIDAISGSIMLWRKYALSSHFTYKYMVIWFLKYGILQFSWKMWYFKKMVHEQLDVYTEIKELWSLSYIMYKNLFEIHHRLKCERHRFLEDVRYF